MKIVESNADQSVEDKAIEWWVLIQSPTVSAEEEKAFFEWLNLNPKHQKSFIEIESFWQRGGALSEAVRVSSPQKIVKTKPFEFIPFGLSVRSLGIFTSSCAALLLMLFLSLNTQMVEEKYQTVYGEQQTVKLSEGSELTLNANSDILVSLGSANVREVVVNKGEVFFSVTPDKTRPFTIKTEQGLVVVLGTKFSVSKMSGVTQVTVVEGSVGLLPGEKQWHGQESEVVLKANQQLELAASLTQPKLVDANKALAWRLGQLHFEGETLLHVVNELNRFYNSSIKLADKSLESKKVVAVFPLKNTFDVNLNHLKRALQLSSTITDSGEVALGIN